jgi:alpha-glucosidase
LGLPEAELLFDELTDPPGIRFWPEYKGRDGSRTPIPWDEGEPPNGFTSGRPWLPVKPPHAALNVASQEADPHSMLHFYRRMLAWRRANAVLADGGMQFFNVAEPVLAFRRTSETGNLVCVFNLSPAPVALSVGGLEGGLTGMSGSAELKGRRLALGGNGFAFLREPGGSKVITLRVIGRRRKAPAPPP